MKTLKEKLESGEVQEINLETEQTIVIFYKDDAGIIHAVFPGQKNGDYCGSYTHIGQHSDCSVQWISDLQLATEDDYQGLANELTDKVGYNLKVINQEIRDLNKLFVRRDKQGKLYTWDDGDIRLFMNIFPSNVFIDNEHYNKGYRGFPGLNFETKWKIIQQEMIWF